MIDILIVEDHESMCEAITSAFTATNRYKVVATVASSDFALMYCEKFKPQLILMDVCTDGGASGLKATQIIKDKYPNIKIIVMTAFDELSYIPRAKAAKADGFIYKAKSFNFFIDIADKIMQGEIYFPEERLVPVPKGEVPLTDREMEVLRLMCKHMTNKEIAEELFITENTVKYHKANMLAKTGFAKSVDLAFYMISNGWINPLF